MEIESPGLLIKYWDSTKLASHVRKPVVPLSIVVRDSSSVTVSYSAESTVPVVMWDSGSFEDAFQK